MANESSRPGRVSDRLHDRVVYGVRITFLGLGLVFPGVVENLSEGGAFVATSDPLPLDTRLRFSLTVDGRTFDVEAVVVWTRDQSEPGRPAGMGVRFVLAPGDKARERIAAFVQSQAR